MQKKESTEGRFDYKMVLDLLKKLNDDKDKIDLQLFHDLCVAFTKISSSMGSLVSWGFQGLLPASHFYRHPPEMPDRCGSHPALPRLQVSPADC